MSGVVICAHQAAADTEVACTMFDVRRIPMSRTILAIAVMLLPLPALAQSAPAADQQAAPQQARPEQRGFSIARPGSAPVAPMAAAHGPAPHAQMAKSEGDMHEGKPGMMKMHARHHAMRHHRRHRHHH
jgi:hypothetical protein